MRKLLAKLLCTILVLPPGGAADLTSVALMACGVGTLLHVIRFKLPWTPYYYGTGVVSVLGITTTQIVIGLNSISNLLVSILTAEVIDACCLAYSVTGLWQFELTSC